MTCENVSNVEIGTGTDLMPNTNIEWEKVLYRKIQVS